MSANWQLFKTIVKGKLENVNDNLIPQKEQETDGLTDLIQTTLVDAFETSCPIRNHKAGKSVPYYSYEDRRQRNI